MSIIVANAQLQATLDWLRALRMGTATVHLYENDYFPTQESLVGDFVEPAWQGYAPFQLSPSDWTQPALNVNGYWSMTTDSYVVINGSGSAQTVYGLFLRYPGGMGALTLSCRFHEPGVIADGGGKRFALEFIQANAPEGTFPPAVLARDDFDAPDGTTLSGRVPPVGPAWILETGTIEILGGAAEVTALSGGFSRAVMDLGRSDATASITFLNPGEPTGMGSFFASFRHSGPANYFVVGRLNTSPNNVTIFRNQAGIYTVIADAPWAWSPGDRVAVKCQGAEITVRVNGTLVIGTTSTFNVFATGWGIELNNLTGSRVDDFLVTKP